MNYNVIQQKCKLRKKNRKINKSEFQILCQSNNFLIFIFH